MTPLTSAPQLCRLTELALVELARIPSDAKLEAVFARACQLSAEALEVERVGVWLFIDNGEVLRCAQLFERSKGELTAGAVLRVADFPAYFASLQTRKSVPAAIAVEESWTAELATEYLRPLGITSMLDAGIFVAGEMVGAVCHEHVGPPREWSVTDRDFAGSVADLIALRIQSAEVRELRSAFQRQQKRLAAQVKLSAMEELSAGIAHDFKNLLTVFRIYGKMLCQRQDLPEDARQQAGEIVKASDRGAALARELMEFARPEFAPPTVIDLASVAEEYLPTLRAAASPQCDVRYSGVPTQSRVLVERIQFTRLLLNLVINGCEAMPNGGVLRVRIATVQLRGGAGAGRYVMVEVKDQGVGMDEATRQRIFEPYFTTKAKGTGLGLPIVQQIVDHVGGIVRVESTPGVGSTFRVYFPAIRCGAAPQAESQS